MSTVYISRGRRRRQRAALLVWLVIAAVAVAATIGVAQRLLPASGSAAQPPQGALAWPVEGAGAVAVDEGAVRTAGSTAPAPIASLAKVMTALVLLTVHPLSENGSGPIFVVTADDVADTAARREQGQSVVPVVAGERLTEREALYAVLLPSANNVAHIVARTVGGSTAAFVARMNEEARRLGMTATRYTDPSGYDPATVSTARDQLVLARAAMRNSAFASIVRTRHATLPVAGTVTNTDSLLGTDGFVGIKTGSDSAAGGCFMFAVRYVRAGRTHLLYGVVLGQRGRPYIAAGLSAARRLAASAVAARPR